MEIIQNLWSPKTRPHIKSIVVGVIVLCLIGSLGYLNFAIKAPAIDKPAPAPTPVASSAPLKAGEETGIVASTIEFGEPYKVSVENDRETGLSGVALIRFGNAGTQFWRLIAEDNCDQLKTVKANHGQCGWPYVITDKMVLRVRVLSLEEKQRLAKGLPLGAPAAVPAIHASLTTMNAGKRQMTSSEEQLSHWVMEHTQVAHTGATLEQYKFQPQPGASTEAPGNSTTNPSDRQGSKYRAQPPPLVDPKRQSPSPQSGLANQEQRP